MDRVIFACVHNAGRSQMAAAFFNQLADPLRASSVSGGTQPGDRVHPVVVDVMRESGIDIGRNRPQRLTEDLARGADAVDHHGVWRRMSVPSWLAARRLAADRSEEQAT